jgi:hypothetical protein
MAIFSIYLAVFTYLAEIYEEYVSSALAARKLTASRIEMESLEISLPRERAWTFNRSDQFDKLEKHQFDTTIAEVSQSLVNRQLRSLTMVNQLISSVTRIPGHVELLKIKFKTCDFSDNM